ncbi:MAG TPA: hypothetical protein VKK79_17320 [Candidatus Lokiarchaeia archaeon]|nr:hypothetical protein [Candidatus Lokiarchaeia archaeon]
MPANYKPKWVLSSKVRTLFEYQGQKIRISGEAKDKVMEYLDKAVEKGVVDLIDKLPKKTKGPQKGELKRITLQAEDLGELKAPGEAKAPEVKKPE